MGAEQFLAAVSGLRHASVYTKIFASGSRSMVYSLYRAPSMVPTARPRLSLNSSKLSPVFFRAGYSWPALVAVSLPVEGRTLHFIVIFQHALDHVGLEFHAMHLPAFFR